jgi:hypothetical protein
MSKLNNIGLRKSCKNNDILKLILLLIKSLNSQIGAAKIVKLSGTLFSGY